ncbi:MAG: hypothetical protein ACPL1Y_06615 [Thermoplasmata archaeon]
MEAKKNIILPMLLLFVAPLVVIAGSAAAKWNLWGIIAGITWLGTGFLYLLTYE